MSDKPEGTTKTALYKKKECLNNLYTKLSAGMFVPLPELKYKIVKNVRVLLKCIVRSLLEADNFTVSIRFAGL